MGYYKTITKLRETTSVEEYNSQFKVFANRTEGLLEAFMISCLLDSLREDIRLTMKVLKPSTLSTVLELIRIQEENVLSRCRDIHQLPPLILLLITYPLELWLNLFSPFFFNDMARLGLLNL